MRRRQPARLVLLFLGYLLLALGALGIALPGLPTTPFILLAVWVFSRSSPRAEQWLRNHPRFGPPIDSWRREGALTTRSKVTASVLKLLALILFYAQTRSLLWTAAVGGVLLLVSLYLWTRPTPSQSS